MAAVFVEAGATAPAVEAATGEAVVRDGVQGQVRVVGRVGKGRKDDGMMLSWKGLGDTGCGIYSARLMK